MKRGLSRFERALDLAFWIFIVLAIVAFFALTALLVYAANAHE